MKFLLTLLIFSSLAVAQPVPKWRWLEYKIDLNLEYSYSQSSKTTFLADVAIRKSERKTNYNTQMLSLTPTLRDATTQKPEAAGSFNTILFRGFLTNDFIFAAFDVLEFRIGESKDSFAQTTLSVKSSSNIAGIKGYVIEVQAPDSQGKRVLTSEFTIAPEFPLPLKIRTFSNGKLENVIELIKVKP